MFFSSDVVAEGIDRPIDRDVYSRVQEFGESSNVRAHQLALLLDALAQLIDPYGPLVCGLEVLYEGFN